MKIKEVKGFKTSDGRIFYNEGAAIKHERMQELYGELHEVGHVGYKEYDLECIVEHLIESYTLVKKG